ncbi:hypothetical protein OK18_05825 [Chryseobacterium gallinarum]|uniref:YD repeat-containing protein n=1 Tax=Chryseobacterium gallinarum TaxID=1324352 RepID=A0A0G3LZ55_CHRGL|nr:hypothetical protein [Chryseobacterium gallinarum]AKK72221.1 hypothetical protein OK18_05825 [Chryseobacterium gallinarum]
MKKNTIAVILLTAFWGHALNGQSSAGADVAKSYVGDINQIFPAAPTSNNLMKFEEVPVSYYTGIPDISIPLFNISTSNSKVPINIQLKYHPLNAKPDDKASETGLGWSLIAGGTISRTIRGGGVDEKDRTIAFSSPPKSKFGIYNHIYNPTYKLLNNEPVNMDDYTFFAGLGRYDTEYDLFQYNFMGYSGRFYIVKDAAGNYKAEKLDRNNLQIRFENNTTGEVTFFTIIDDKGIKYIFSPMEKSQKSITNTKTGLTTGIGNIDGNEEIDDYWASFHLTKITDQNNVALALFKYELSSLVKFEEPTTRTFRVAKDVYYYNTSQNTSGTQQNPDGNMPGAIESQTVYNTTNTKLLTSIEIVDKGIVYLNYEKGRQDSNYIQPAELYKLKSIQSNYLGQNITNYTEKYTFDYGYTDTYYQHNTPLAVLKKMILNKITKISPNNQNQEYTLEYYKTGGVLSKDNWGYYKANTSDIKNDVIKSITYPTKGKVVFDFGTNDYSHYYSGGSGSMYPIQGYLTKQERQFSVHFGSFDADKQSFFTVNSPQTVKLHAMIGNLIYYNWIFKIYKKISDNNFVEVYEKGDGNQTCNIPQPPYCEVSTVNPDGVIISDYLVDLYLEPGTYYASLTGSYYPSIPEDITDTFSVTTKEDVFVNETKRNGGGLRINNIQYFDTPVSPTPSKEFMYDYRDINTPQKSSGSLVFPEPVLSYSDSYSYRNKVNNADIVYSANFDIKTDYNILPFQKTQGSDVGYKYVTVKQIVRGNNNAITDNGSTVYTFRSPLDFPNQGSLALQPPIMPIPNLDYLRGQLVSEKKYNSSGQLLSEINTNYSVTEIEKNDGIKLQDNFYRNSVGEYFIYNSYQELFFHAGAVQLTTPYKNYEKFGITLPSKKTETSYFYENGVQSSVTSTTNNTYNSFDYPSLSMQFLPDGSTTTTNYLYATEKNNQKLINANMIGIPLETGVTQKLNNLVAEKTIAKTEVIYDPSTSSLFPDAVMGLNTQTNAMETKIKYDKYDSKGNLEEYTLKEGTPVTIIWGYNKTLPIAKIEGVRMSDIQQSSIMSIVNASDADASAAPNNDESALLSALDIFRKTAVPRALITTYTYDPLVGVRSIIQPSGVKELYFYDTENRIKEIKQETRDAGGNVSYKILKEYQYHFKN